MPLRGFWSYVHRDDAAEQGRIVQLGRDVAAQFEILTGEELELFVDRDDLRWGDAWRSRIDGSLSDVAFFVAVVTPRYLRSDECRRELTLFASAAQAAGYARLLLPIRYTGAGAIGGADSDQLAATLLSDTQWEDWRDVRLCARDSETYRRAVARLAGRLVEAHEAVERDDQRLAPGAESQSSAVPDDDAPGALEELAALEVSLPSIAEIVNAVAENIGTIGQLVANANVRVAKLDAQGASIGARIQVAARLAGELGGPVSDIERLSTDYARALAESNPGMLRLIGSVFESDSSEDLNSAEGLRPFLHAVSSMAASAREGLSQVSTLRQSATRMGASSKALRPVMRRFDEAIASFVGASELLDTWDQGAREALNRLGEGEP